VSGPLTVHKAGEIAVGAAMAPVTAEQVQYDYRPKIAALNPRQVMAILATDDASYQRIGTLWRALKDLVDEVKSRIEPAKTSAYRAHRAVCDLESDLIREAVQAIAHCESQMNIREREVARLQREAKEAEDRRLAEEKRLADEKAIAQATELEAAGHVEAAAAVVEEATAPELPVVAPLVAQPAAPAGVATGKTYHAEVQEGGLKLLCRAVLDGKAPEDAIEASMTFLNMKARKLKREGEMYPGVVVVADTSRRRTRNGTEDLL
jgi:hypothetical protein